MAGKKITCSKCRRLYDNKIEYCPYCGSPNPLLVASSEMDEESSIIDATYREVDEVDNKEIDTYSDEVIEEYDDSEAEVEEKYDEYENSEEYGDYDEEFEDSSQKNAYASELTSSTNRKKVDWDDEKERDTSNDENMYNEDGEYNPNYDHYYDDTKAKIDNELESLAVGKEKAILKAVGGVAAVIGIIIYLVLTL